MVNTHDIFFLFHTRQSLSIVNSESMPGNFVPDRLHIRNVILFLFLSQSPMKDAERNMATVYKEHAPHYNTIRSWYGRFEKGDFSLKDEEHPGRPLELDLDALKNLVESDPFASSTEMASTLGVDHKTITHGLRILGKVKKLGRFVPHTLSQFDLDRRVDLSTTLLTMYQGERWLDRLITGDEKWVHYSNHHRRAQWVDRDEQPDDVPKPDLHPKKVMLCVWWTINGPIYWELLPAGQTITADVYSRQLRDLKKAVDASPLAKHKAYFQHDNARPHVARQTMSQLSKLGWIVLPHPPYSPDLAPSDYWLFGELQRHLEGRDFTNPGMIKAALKQFFDSRPDGWYKHGIHKLPERWQQVIDNDGQYV